MSTVLSVIKVTTTIITLENDETGQTHEFPVERFWEIVDFVKMGQIFRWNEEDDTLIFDEEETNARRVRVASLLARLNKK